jgi:hypothetical protein
MPNLCATPGKYHTTALLTLTSTPRSPTYQCSSMAYSSILSSIPPRFLAASSIFDMFMRAFVTTMLDLTSNLSSSISFLKTLSPRIKRVYFRSVIPERVVPFGDSLACALEKEHPLRWRERGRSSKSLSEHQWRCGI